MQRLIKICGPILFSITLSIVFSCVFSASSNVGIWNALVCLVGTLIATFVYYKIRDNENVVGDNKNKWLDLIFLLEKYQLTDKNSSIYCDYINFVKRETFCPPTRMALKINGMLKNKGLQHLEFDVFSLKKEAFGYACWTFGLCGILSSIISFAFLVNSLSFFFWISLVIFIGSTVMCLYMIYDEDECKIFGILSGALIVLFLIVALILGVKWIRKCNSPANIGILVEEKESSIEYGYVTKYKTTFSLAVTNNCPRNIEYFEGEMLFYNGDEQIGKANVSFKSALDSEGSLNMTLEFLGSNEFYQQLYSTSFDKMKIEYNITTIKFEGKKSRTFDDEYRTIKSPVTEQAGPFSNLKNSQIGQTVTFGKYETNCDFNTVEDLEWIVLKKEGNKILLISKMSLASTSYGDWREEDYTSWKNSEIRSYLNGIFYYDCFTEQERALIATTTNIPNDEEIELGAVQTSDKVFIPSSYEMNSWFYSSEDMRCLSTGNTTGGGAKFGIGAAFIDDYNTYCSYWLRDAIPNAAYGFPAQCFFQENNSEINPYYGINATLTYNNSYYIRACLWVDLSSISE